jgi:hypothetical protein
VVHLLLTLVAVAVQAGFNLDTPEAAALEPQELEVLVVVVMVDLLQAAHQVQVTV